jgi:hypothetical protein
MAEICSLLSMPEYKTTTGSSIPRRFFSELLDHFGLPDEGDSVQAAKSLTVAARLEWKGEFDSSESPSGGGGTVTLHGLMAMRQAVTILLDEEEADASGVADTYVGFDSAQINEWTLLKGQSIKRKLLHDRYGGVRQGGIAPSNRTSNVLLFTDDASNQEHGYETDHWIDDETFLYCGEGQNGNQSLTRYNFSIFNHKAQNRALRLFSPVSGEVTYLGELEIDSENPCEWIKGYGRDGTLREVVMFRLKRVIRSPEERVLKGFNEIPVEFGSIYKFADEGPRAVAMAEPFSTDPNLLDRALQSHSITQNMIATWVLDAGITPLSPSNETCDFDIAWNSEYEKVVCEVKSLSAENERHQIRFGLGQVLEYAHLLGAAPILVFSRKPDWLAVVAVARRAGVAILWPEILNRYDPKDLRNVRHF